MSERAEIQNAADLTGEAWLHYMAKFGEPAVTPEAWAAALSASRTVVAEMSSSHKKPMLCRLLGHAPGEETWPIGVCWCRRCGAKCTRNGRDLSELRTPPASRDRGRP